MSRVTLCCLLIVDFPFGPSWIFFLFFHFIFRAKWESRSFYLDAMKYKKIFNSVRSTVLDFAISRKSQLVFNLWLAVYIAESAFFKAQFDFKKPFKTRVSRLTTNGKNHGGLYRDCGMWPLDIPDSSLTRLVKLGQRGNHIMLYGTHCCYNKSIYRCC